jgi:hypothetical protein
MTTVTYTILNGVLPVTVKLIGSGVPDNEHSAYGQYSFVDVPDGSYTIEFWFDDGCNASEVLSLCEDCPSGWTPTIDGCTNYLIESPTYTEPVYTIIKKAADNAYTNYGILIFDSWSYDGTGSFTWSAFSPQNLYWINPYPGSGGVMNRSSVWASVTKPNQDIGFSFCIDIAIGKTYYVGFGCDNWGKIKLNGDYILEQDRTSLINMFTTIGGMPIGGDPNAVTFKYWYIYPIYIPAGQNIIEVFGHNEASVAGVGIEIYDVTKQQLIDAISDTDLGDGLLFRSADLVGQNLSYEYSAADGYHGYSCPEGYALDTCGETVQCVKKETLECGETTTTTTSTTAFVCTQTLALVASDDLSAVSYLSGGFVVPIQPITFTGIVGEIEVKVTIKQGSPNFNVRCKIYNGTVTDAFYPFSNSLVAQSNNIINASSFTQTYQTILFEFDPVQLDGVYSITFEYEDVITHNTTNRFQYRTLQSGTYAGGRYRYYYGTTNTEGIYNSDMFINICYNTTEPVTTTTTTTTEAPTTTSTTTAQIFTACEDFAPYFETTSTTTTSP